MKHKLIPLLLLAALLPRGARADNGVWLELAGGITRFYAFSDAPTITYDGDDLVMTTTGATATLPLTDVVRLYITDDGAPVEPGEPAGDQPAGIVLELVSGNVLYFDFAADAPVVTYDDEHLTISAATPAGVTLLFTDVVRLYHADRAVDNAVSQPDTARQRISLTAGGARLEGFDAGQPVALYDLSGRIVDQLRTGADGSLSVSLDALPRGIYIIKANNTTLKIKH